MILLAGCGGGEFDDAADGDSDADSDSDADTDSDSDGPVCEGGGPKAVDWEVWNYIFDVDYRNTWTHEPGSEGRRPSDGYHGGVVEVVVNGCIAATWGTGAEQYPTSSMIVLDRYAGGDLPLVFVSYRTTDEPGENGWWWAAYDELGVTQASGGPEAGCSGCHSSGDDYVQGFTLDGV